MEHAKQNGSAAMEVDGDLRLLAVFCNQEEEDPGYDPSTSPNCTPTFVSTRPGAKVGGAEVAARTDAAAAVAETGSRPVPGPARQAAVGSTARQLRGRPEHDRPTPTPPPPRRRSR